MRNIQLIAVLAAILFGLNACNFKTEEPLTQNMETATETEHVGCQEGEIDINGNCQPAENSNVKLFDQDLDASVYSMTLNKENLTGFLAEPKTGGPYPGIVMIHEWWGLNDNIKEMAKILANEGYVVFAVDLYGGQVATTSERAGQLASSVRDNPEEAIATMKQAVDYLKQQNVTRIASLGWCFGGQQSLNLSLNEDLDATVIYYGQLIDDKTQLQTISGPVLGIFGSEDTSIPVESVRRFETALNELTIPNEIHVYEGVGHAFANPSGSNYAEAETRDAWAKTIDFLNRALKI